MGISNPLLGRYFHDSNMAITLTDALFDLNYIALNVGGSITLSGDAFTSESVIVGADGAITITGTPVQFGDAWVAWATKAGEDNWQKVTLTGATHQSGTVQGSTQGDTWCVMYNNTVTSEKKLVVPAEIIPAIGHLVVTYPLFVSGSSDYTSATRAGEIIVDIPKYQFDGAVDLSLTSGGAASIPLSGMALATNTSSSCEDANIFGTIKQVISGANWYDGIIGITRDGGLAISGAAQDVKSFDIIGVWADGTTASIDLTLLTITTDSHGTVDTANKTITLISSGDVEVQVTNKTSIACTVTLTVA